MRGTDREAGVAERARHAATKDEGLRTRPRPRPRGALPGSHVIVGAGIAILALLGSVGALAGDRVVLETTDVTGNDELPKVLYVLPWREVPGEPPAADAPPALGTTFLEPLDPVTHRRQIRTYRRLVGHSHEMENER